MGLPTWVEEHEKWDLSKRRVVVQVVKDLMMDAFSKGIPFTMVTTKCDMCFTINDLQKEDGSNQSYNFEGFDKYSSIKGWVRLIELQVL